MEFVLANRIHALHDFYEPAPGIKCLISQKERPLPLREHDVFGLCCRSRTKKTFPELGIWLKRMLQPTQPARLAVSARGFRSSMTSRTKNCFGTTNRFVTPRF